MLDPCYMATIGYIMDHDILIYLAVNFMSPVPHDLDSTSQHCPATGHRLAMDLGRVTKDQNWLQLATGARTLLESSPSISIRIVRKFPLLWEYLSGSHQLQRAWSHASPSWRSDTLCPAPTKQPPFHLSELNTGSHSLLCLLCIRVVVSKR